MKTQRSPFFTKLVRLLFSHVGLLFLVLIYMIAGAFLFQMLEENARIQSCQEGSAVEALVISKYRQFIFNLLFYNAIDDENMSDNETTNYILTYKQDANIKENAQFKQILKDFRSEIILIQDEYFYFGQNCLDDESWDIQSAFLFTLSLITTIGKQV